MEEVFWVFDVRGCVIKPVKECNVVYWTDNLNSWCGKSDIMWKVRKRVGGSLKVPGVDGMKQGEAKRWWAELALLSMSRWVWEGVGGWVKRKDGWMRGEWMRSTLVRALICAMNTDDADLDLGVWLLSYIAEMRILTGLTSEGHCTCDKWEECLMRISVGWKFVMLMSEDVIIIVDFIWPVVCSLFWQSHWAIHVATHPIFGKDSSRDKCLS